jgi:hypothetical protein
MISRRQFTITLVLTPVASWLAACGGGDGYGGSGSARDGTTSDTSPTIACDGVGAKSSLVEGHAHDLCVPANDLSSPPGGGATYTTTTEDGHTHQVTLDAAQLAAVGRGEVVRVTTTTTEGHVHTYSLARAGTITPPPQPGGSSGSSSGSGGY